MLFQEAIVSDCIDEGHHGWDVSCSPETKQNVGAKLGAVCSNWTIFGRGGRQIAASFQLKQPGKPVYSPLRERRNNRCERARPLTFAGQTAALPLIPLCPAVRFPSDVCLRTCNSRFFHPPFVSQGAILERILQGASTGVSAHLTALQA